MRLTTHLFSHGSFSVELLAPAAPDELIDVSDFNQDERLPYWAELWPSARALATELLEMPLPAGRALELGCGIGLPSLVLSHRGAEVTASDYYPEALDFTLRNAERNGIAPPHTLLLDWRHPPPGLSPFELIVAADVLYEERNADALARLLPAIAAPDARILIADPGRTHLEPFRERMAAQRWEMREHARHLVPVPETGREVTVRIHALWRERRPVIGPRRSCRRS